MNKINTLQDLEEIKKRVRPLLAVREDSNFAKFKESRQIDVLVCRGTGCTAAGADEVEDAFREAIKRRGLEKRVRVNVTKIGCRGFCEKGPNVTITPGDILYSRVRRADVDEIVEKHLVRGEIVEKSEIAVVKVAKHCPFAKQPPELCSLFGKFVDGFCEVINPEYGWCQTHKMTDGDGECRWVCKKEG